MTQALALESFDPFGELVDGFVESYREGRQVLGEAADLLRDAKREVARRAAPVVRAFRTAQRVACVTALVAGTALGVSLVTGIAPQALQQKVEDVAVAASVSAADFVQAAESKAANVMARAHLKATDAPAPVVVQKAQTQTAKATPAKKPEPADIAAVTPQQTAADVKALEPDYRRLMRNTKIARRVELASVVSGAPKEIVATMFAAETRGSEAACEGGNASSSAKACLGVIRAQFLGTLAHDGKKLSSEIQKSRLDGEAETVAYQAAFYSHYVQRAPGAPYVLLKDQFYADTGRDLDFELDQVRTTDLADVLQVRNVVSETRRMIADLAKEGYSRAYLERKIGGTATLYYGVSALGPGFKSEIKYVLKGKSNLTMAGNVWSLRTGEINFSNPKKPGGIQRLVATPRLDMTPENQTIGDHLKYVLQPMSRIATAFKTLSHQAFKPVAGGSRHGRRHHRRPSAQPLTSYLTASSGALMRVTNG